MSTYVSSTNLFLLSSLYNVNHASRLFFSSGLSLQIVNSTREGSLLIDLYRWIQANLFHFLVPDRPELKKRRSHRLISWVEIPLGYFSDHVSLSYEVDMLLGSWYAILMHNLSNLNNNIN